MNVFLLTIFCLEGKQKSSQSTLSQLHAVQNTILASSGSTLLVPIKYTIYFYNTYFTLLFFMVCMGQHPFYISLIYITKLLMPHRPTRTLRISNQNFLIIPRSKIFWCACFASSSESEISTFGDFFEMSSVIFTQPMMMCWLWLMLGHAMLYGCE